MQEHTEMWNEGTNIWKIQCLQPNQTTMPSSVKSFLIFTASYVDQLCSCIGKLYTNYITLPTYNLIYSEWGQRNAYCTQFTTNLQSQLPQIMLAHTHIVWKDTWRPFTNSFTSHTDRYNCCKTPVSLPQSGKQKAGFSPRITNKMMFYCIYVFSSNYFSWTPATSAWMCLKRPFRRLLWQTSFEYASL